MTPPIYILTSSNLLFKTDSYVEQNRQHDYTAQGVLNLKLEQYFGLSVFKEQKDYLQKSAIASYLAFNKLEQRQNFRAKLNLIPTTSHSFQLCAGSSSSGLGYALALFQTWRIEIFNKNGFSKPIFSTGQINQAGDIEKISHLDQKITTLLQFVQNQQIQSFDFCFPKQNEADITPQQRQNIQSLGGTLYPADRLADLLSHLLTDYTPPDFHPFIGLKPFEYEDNVRFFGREEEAKRLFDDLNYNKGLLIVAGDSGTGKSSLIKAGLIPKLELHYQQKVYFASTTPNKENKKQGLIFFILRSLITAWKLESPETHLRLLTPLLTQSTTEWIKHLKQIEARYYQDNADTVSCVLHLDQYEETFCQTEQNEKAIAQELALFEILTQQLSHLKIILALRSEYLAPLLNNQVLKSPIISNLPTLLPAKSWQQIVQNQADFSSVEFETNPQTKQPFDKEIINEATVLPYALPMVAFLLEQLYNKAKARLDKKALQKNGGIRLNLSDFQTMGGLKGAIANRADQVLAQYKATKNQINLLFETLVGLNQNNLPYARHLDLTSLSQNQTIQPLIQALVKANLIIAVEQQQVKLAHDCLFQHWQKLKDWIEQAQIYLHWLFCIEPMYCKWLDSNKKWAFLIKDKALLNEGKHYLKKKQAHNPVIQEYIKRSVIYQFIKRFIFIFVPLFIILIITGWSYDHYWRVKSYCYANYGTHYSIPFGISELTDEQVKHISASYRLDYQGGLLRKMQYQNHFGILKTNPDEDMRPNTKEVAVWEFNYTENNELNQIVYKSKENKLLRIEEYEFFKKDGIIQSAIVDFKKSKGFSGDFTFKVEDLMRSLNTSEKISMQKLLSKTKAFSYINELNKNQVIPNIKHKLFYNKKGETIKRLYQDLYGKRKPNNINSFGQKYAYNLLGLIQFKYDIFENKNTLASAKKIGTKYTYTDDGQLFRKELINKKQETIFSENFYRDKYGNLTNWVQTNKNNEESNNIMEIRYEYSDGNLTQKTFYDINKNLILNNEGIAIWKGRYDHKGNLIEVHFLGKNRKPVLNKNGVSSIKLKYNRLHAITEHLFFGLEEKPTLNNEGYFKLINIYTNDNNTYTIETKRFGLNGKPVTLEMGFSSNIMSYNKDGQLIQMMFFDQKGNPVISKEHGFFRETKTYDQYGNILNNSYYGTTGKPILLDNNFSQITRNYNYKNNSITILRKNDHQIVSGSLIKLNQYNRIISIACLNSAKEISSCGYGFSYIKIKYNKNKKANKISFFDKQHKKTTNEVGVSTIIYQYDLQNRLTEISFFDTHGQQVAGFDNGVTKLIIKYDNKNNIIKFTYFILKTPYYIRIKSEQTNIGYKLKKTYFNLDNTPANIPESNLLLIEQLFFDNKKIYIVRELIDDKGNILEKYYYNQKHQPVLLSTGGYAIVKMEYNKNHEITKINYLGLDGKPIMNKDGYASKIATYDAHDRIIKKSTFDVINKLVLSKQKFAVMTAKYNEKNLLIEKAYFDTNNKPILNTNGIAKIIFKYNGKGQLIEQVNLGIHNEHVLHKLGFSSVTLEYKSGRLYRLNYFDINGKLLHKLNGQGLILDEQKIIQK